MERKEDLILECFVLKGKGVDWLGVIYLENKTNLKAFYRVKMADRSYDLRFLGGSSRQSLSKELTDHFTKAAALWGISPLHLEYPEGVGEGAFIRGLREAQKEWGLIREKARN